MTNQLIMKIISRLFNNEVLVALAFYTSGKM